MLAQGLVGPWMSLHRLSWVLRLLFFRSGLLELELLLGNVYGDSGNSC